jgi:hypothetical protein
MHPRKGPHDLKMAEFLRSDVHQQIFSCSVFAIEALDRVLHRSGKFAVGAAKLFQKHIAKARIRLVNPHGVHKFFDMVIHEILS